MNDKIQSTRGFHLNQTGYTQPERRDPNSFRFDLEHFKPLSMVQEQRGLQSTPTHGPYRGNHNSQSHGLHDSNCPDEENCSLWLTKVHCATTLAQFFQTIHTGAVFAASMKEPEGDHNTRPVKLVFMTHEGAAQYLHIVENFGIFFHGLRVEGRYNRDGYRVTDAWRAKSRVLHISGPAPVMEIDKWIAFFGSAVRFQLETWSYLRENYPGIRAMEFRFARVDGQAEAIFLAIGRSSKMQGVGIQYGPDPCDPAPRIKAYS
jgi:hypothetical protein